MNTRLLLCLCFILSSFLAHAATTLWIEGEDATTHSEDISIQHPFVSRHPALSGGVSLGGHGKVGETFVEFQTDIPREGTYKLYVRKFWHHGPFRWRFGDDAWRELDRPALMDSVGLDRIHMVINWVFAGEVELPAGSTTLRFEQTRDAPFVIDCLVITDGEFFPRGNLKPGERSGKNEEGFFAWEPPPDPLDGESLLDLRHLNEPTAGGHGHVRREGDRFMLGDGTPVRFWMVQADLRDMNNAQIDRWARRLAKYGVNLVRMNFSNFFNQRVRRDDAAFARELERLHYVVAALKREGIYSYFGHLYWHTHHQINDNVHPGFKNENALALLIFSERFQQWYLQYVRALMEPVNPYTGISLAKDPSVAFVEIWNESNLLFWTFNPARMNAADVEIMEKSFAEWLIKTHGSIKQAMASWGRDRSPNVRTPDRPSDNRMGLYAIGHLTGADWAQNQRVDARAADQLRWMVESTRTFYNAMVESFRNDIGIKSLIAGSNWKTADARILAGLDRWTYTATDVVLRNAYFSPAFAKDGNPRFYEVDVGDTFKDASSLKAPATPGPLLAPHIAGYPFMVTENNWTRPSQYRAEWPFLVATYASMMGVDGWNFFALDTAEWQHRMAVWDLNNPTVLGQFPATALMFRRGDVATPDIPAVHEHVSLPDAYRMRGTALFCGGGRDVLWVDRIGDQEGAPASGSTQVDPRAFFVGPVQQTFADGPGRVETVALQKYIDNEAQVVRSLTDELRWDFTRGVVTVNTPRAQGATGFLRDVGLVELRDITLESQNEYGSLLVVSLDGEPLRNSRDILVQAATRDHPYGFATETVEDGFQRITRLGSYPLNVENIHMQITLKTAGARTVTVLDENGYPTDRIAETDKDHEGRLRIRLPQDSLYIVIR